MAEQLPAAGCANPGTAFASAATSGLIRHAQWTAALQSAANQHAKLAAQASKGKGASLPTVFASKAQMNANFAVHGYQRGSEDKMLALRTRMHQQALDLAAAQRSWTGLPWTAAWWRRPAALRRTSSATRSGT